jgi:taurine dioxygenase
VLYGNIIPPVGGDTLFANQCAAWEGLSGSMKALLKDKMAIHSARKGYARDGMYGEKDKGRSMAIKYGDSALKTQLHRLARPHGETGRLALYVSPGYTIGIEGIPDEEALPILKELYVHQAKPEYVYRHKWSQGTLVMWDNRSVIHAATGATRAIEGCCIGSPWRTGHCSKNCDDVIEARRVFGPALFLPRHAPGRLGNIPG